MVIVFGECLFVLGIPNAVFLINVIDAAESNNAVFALSYFVQQGLKCGKVTLLLRATFVKPSGSHRHFGVHSLLARDPPMMLRRVASLLCPIRGVPHVALVCPFLHLNPWVQQYPSGSYAASSSQPLNFLIELELVVGAFFSIMRNRRWLSSINRCIDAIVASN